MRFVVLATELYKYSSGDFYNEVERSAAYSIYQKKIVAHQNGMMSILLAPSTVDSAGNAILVQRMLVKTKDNTIFNIDAYISPAAFKSKDQFIKLSKRIFETLQIGSRVPHRKATAEKVNIWGTKMNFELTVPRDYNVTVDRKVDFQVIGFHRFTDFADTTWQELTIYTGNFPWKDYKHYGFNEDSAKSVPDVFINKPISWMMFMDKVKPVFVKEQKIPLEPGDGGLLVHIGMVSDKLKMVDELTDIVRTIKLEN